MSEIQLPRPETIAARIVEHDKALFEGVLSELAEKLEQYVPGTKLSFPLPAGFPERVRPRVIAALNKAGWNAQYKTISQRNETEEYLHISSAEEDRKTAQDYYDK